MIKYLYFAYLFLIVFSTQAQYVTRSERYKKNFVSKIEIKSKDIFIVNKPLVLCDTLIMHDGATLKVKTTKPFIMYARYVDIGKKCLIDASGDHGTPNSPNGKDGIHVSLQFNIHALGHLLIKTKGGDVAKGNEKSFSYRETNVIKLPGSGGNINFYYYSPVAISFRRKSRNKPSFWFNTERGLARAPSRFRNQHPTKPTTNVRLGHINGKDVIYRVEVADPNRSHYNDDKFSAEELLTRQKKKGKSIFIRLEKPVKF